MVGFSADRRGLVNPSTSLPPGLSPVRLIFGLGSEEENNQVFVWRGIESAGKRLSATLPFSNSLLKISPEVLELCVCLLIMCGYTLRSVQRRELEGYQSIKAGMRESPLTAIVKSMPPRLSLRSNLAGAQKVFT